MTTIHQKHEILESLKSLDQTQSEKVLEYIKGLVYATPDDASKKKFKQEAMKEIRYALGKGRRVRPAF
jgi:mRNA-degrading endonuclease RelE of RelBE toxin-antitoxin system